MSRQHRLRIAALLTSSVLPALMTSPVTAEEQGSAPVALVIELSGTATVQLVAEQDGANPETRELLILDRLKAGDVVRTGVESRLVLAFLNGNRYELPGEAEATVEAERLHMRRGKVRSLGVISTSPAIAAIPVSAQAGRRSGGTAFRKIEHSLWHGKIEDLYPWDGIPVRIDQAVLSFTPVGHNEVYRIAVENDESVIVFSLETRASEVVVPAGVLRPDADYFWNVRTAGPRSQASYGEAYFRTLTREEEAWLARTSQQLHAEGTFSATLLLAEIYRGLDMYRDACTALESIAEHPDAAEANKLFHCHELGTQTAAEVAAEQ